MKHGLTQRERATFKVKAKKDEYGRIEILVLAILIVIAIGQIVSILGFDTVSTAYAQTNEYHPNSYYCAGIEAGTPVIGATHAQLLAVCPNLK